MVFTQVCVRVDWGLNELLHVNLVSLLHDYDCVMVYGTRLIHYADTL